jgi:hypothetical protein
VLLDPAATVLAELRLLGGIASVGHGGEFAARLSVKPEGAVPVGIGALRQQRAARSSGGRAGGAAALPFGGEQALAQLSNAGRFRRRGQDQRQRVPEGPSERALAALADAARRGNRYQYPRAEALVQAAATLEGLRPEHSRSTRGRASHYITR